MPISNEWDVDFTSLLVSHQDGRLRYDGGNGKVPAVDMAVTGSASGATAVVLTASDGSTAAAGTLFLTDVQDGAAGPFLDNEGVTGSNDFSASMIEELIPTQQAYIDYDALEKNFSSSDIGAALTGAASTATAEIVDVRVDIEGSTGRLFLVSVSGVFTDDEIISGSHGGIAAANTGSVFASLNFDAQTSDFTINTILTGTTSFASASIVGIRDKGTKGTLYLGPITGAFVDGEEIVDNNGVTPGSGTANGLVTFVTVQWPSNRLYSFLQDTFDELGNMDDTVPWSAQVQNQQYTKINAWTSPNLSTRYLKKGSVQTSSLGEIWTDYQTLGTIAEDPLLYIEQSGSVLTNFWDRGQFDVLIRNKSVNELIDGGAVTIFAREYGTLYDNFRTTALAGASPIPLATAVDLNNATDSDIVRDYDRTNLVFVNNEVGFTSGTFGGTLPVESDVVYDWTNGGSGYVLSSSTTGDSGSLTLGNVTGTIGTALEQIKLVSSMKFEFQSASFIQNQVLSNSLTPTAWGTVVRVDQIGGRVGRVYMSGVTNTAGWTDGADIYVDGTRYATVSGTVNLSGTWIASASSNVNADTVHKDIGDGNGEQPYDAVYELSGATLLQAYERSKYLTRDLSLDFVDTVEGRIYISANTGSYAAVKSAPIGTFAGGTMFAARGIFLQNMAAADIRSYQLTDASGTVRNPPNLQTIAVTSLVSGDRVTVFPLSASTSLIFKNQYQASGDGAGTALTVDETIQTETPESGVVRVVDTSHNYNSFAGSVFTLDSPHTGVTAGVDVYVPYIEEESAGTSVSVNVVHATDRPIKIRVRKKGILPFEVDSTFTATGASVAAIRTTDTIVDP